MPLLTLNRTALSEIVEFVKIAVPEKPIIEADGNLTIAYADGILTLSASDGVQGAKVTIPVAGDGVEPFTVGCDPKRLAKILTKDTSASITLMRTPEGLNIADEEDGFNKYSTLAGANMSRASRLVTWKPKTPSNELEVPTAVLQECLSFLEDFFPDGKDEGTKYDLAVLDNKLSYVPNGVNMRGIFLSSSLPFTMPVTVRKRYINSFIKGLKAISEDTVHITDDVRMISVSNATGTKSMVIPKARQEASSAPMSYLQDLGDPVEMDVKEVLKGLDKLSSSNYNTTTSITGVVIKLHSEGDTSTFQMILEGNKAASTHSVKRTGTDEVDKVLDLKSFVKVLKVFSKSTGAKFYFGSPDTKYLRVVQKKTAGANPYACITLCAYNRKLS